MKAFCPNCGLIELTVAQQLGGKLACGAASYAFGARVSKNPVIAILCTVAGIAIGNAIDKEISKRCPQCGAILRATGLL